MTDSARRFQPSWYWALALLPFLVLVVFQWSHGCGLSCGDYAQYYLHASAILKARPYADIGYIYTSYNPWLGPPMQPPGFPLTLVPIFAVWGPNPVAIKLVTIVSSTLFLLLAGFRFARTDGPHAAAAVVLFSGIGLVAMGGTSDAVADPGFLALIWGCLLVADGAGAWTVRRIALVTILGFGALSYRTAGVALVPAMLVFALMRREGRRPFVPPLIWMAAGAIAAITLSAKQTVFANLNFSLSAIFFSIKSSVYTYGRGTAEVLLYPFPWGRADDVYHLIALPILLVGLVALLWRTRRTAMAAFFVIYMCMLFVVPVREPRYLWPLLPIFAMGFFEGLRILFSLGSRIARPRSTELAFAIVALLAASSTIVVMTRPSRPSLLRRPDVRALFARVGALPHSITPRVVFYNPHVLTWYTGVAAMPPFSATTAEMMAELRRQRITHVVTGDLGTEPRLDSALRRVVADSSAAFEPVYRDSVFALLALRVPAAVDSARPR